MVLFLVNNRGTFSDGRDECDCQKCSYTIDRVTLGLPSEKYDTTDCMFQ